MSDKERLKDIKNARYFFHDLLHDVQDSDLIKDWNWLIEQAEKAQELQEENKRYHETLKFYADEKHYEPYCIDGYGCDVTEDGGEIARKALEGE